MFGFIGSIFRKYPVHVQILEKRGNVIQIMKDKACRVIERDGTQYYHLKKKNTKFKPPEYRYFFVDKKGKPILFLYSPQQGQFFPLNLDNPPDLIIEDKDMMFWNLEQTKKTYAIYPYERSWLEKYAPWMMAIFTATIMILIVLFTFPHIASTAGSVASISAELARVTQMLTGWSPPAPGT